MKLTIENTLGIRRAEIELIPGQVLEVVGPNASGKTSLAVCAQAVLARESNPLGLSAADAKRSYPHDGAEDARVMLLATHGYPNDVQYGFEWHPSRGTVVAAKDVMLSHPEAVGLVDFTAKRGAKERAAVFQNALLPDPMTVLAAVKEALAAYLPEADLVGVMQMLEERGWEPTAGVYEERGRQAKREWRDVTNRTYGVRAAADWRPDGWLADFDLMAVQEAEAKVTDARDALNAIHRVQAISEADQQRALEAREALPAFEAATRELLERMDAKLAGRDAIPAAAARREADAFQGQIAEAQKNKSGWQSCPNCGHHLVLQNGIIVSDESTAEEWDAQIAELQANQEAAESRASRMEEEYNAVDAELIAIRAEHGRENASLFALRQAASIEGQVQSEAGRVALAQAEQAVGDALEVVRLVRAEADAGRLHETIVRYTEIARALGPEGVRARMLADGFKKMNAGLRVVANVSGWPLTAVADSSSITIGGRPVQMCSESERWRAQAAIQLTLAAITESKAVVLDRGDLLDQANRHGLAMALQRVAEKTGMAILLCSTGNAGLGFNVDTRWPVVAIDDGQVVS